MTILSLSAYELTLFGATLALFELVALWMVVFVLLDGRTSQGTLAWILGLIFMPFVGVPLFLLFGRRRFTGYLQARQRDSRDFDQALPQSARKQILELAHKPEKRLSLLTALEHLAEMPTVVGNRTQLLVDGNETFDSILQNLDQASEYVLLQSYILKADRLGTQLKQKLIELAQKGIRIYLLLDGIGSYSLAPGYRSDLEAAGIELHFFTTSLGRQRRFQVNFRNHRKIVIIDGRIAYVGGHNIADAYREETRRFGHWRDTHLRVEGPTVQQLQLIFLEDWYWVCHQMPELCWEPRTLKDGFPALVLPTGPADKLESGSLMFLALINAARNRLWLASPYFIPDQAVTGALQLAATRGVDVRVILPGRPDKYITWMAAYPFILEAGKAGIRFYRFKPGFLHQKVILVDDDVSCIGTANIDNRSLRLNFEVSLLAIDKGVATATAEMLENDIASSQQLDPFALRSRHIFFRITAAASRLFAPLL